MTGQEARGNAQSLNCFFSFHAREYESSPIVKIRFQAAWTNIRDDVRWLLRSTLSAGVRQWRASKRINRKISGEGEILVGRAGIEPAANGLKVRCSTAELTAHCLRATQEHGSLAARRGSVKKKVNYLSNGFSI